MTVRRRIHWIKLAWILAPALVACASVADSATDPNSAAEQGFEIAFESDRGGSSDVWVLTGKGKQHPLTGGGSVEAQPSPAPSPQQGVASYMSDRDGDFDIYAETRNGTVQVTNHPAPDYAPAWTPDGTRIAFVSERFGSKDVFVASVEPGVSFQRLTSSPNADTDPAWAPNSVRIALASNRAGTYDIWFFDLGSKHRLTHNGANDFEPAFSPSGGRVAFTRRNKFGNYDIYVIQANGNGLMRLTTNAAEDSEPTWSPDGEQIAFVSNRGGSYDIFIMNADGTGQTNFSQSPAASTYHRPGRPAIRRRKPRQRRKRHSAVSPARASGRIAARGSSARRAPTSSVAWVATTRSSPLAETTSLAVAAARTRSKAGQARTGSWPATGGRTSCSAATRTTGDALTGRPLTRGTRSKHSSSHDAGERNSLRCSPVYDAGRRDASR